MEKVPALNFKKVILTTNGFQLQNYLQQIAASVHELVISLDTLDCQKADCWYGIGTGALDRILTNIDLTAEYHRSRKFRVVISSVVTPENIPDLYEVFRYSQLHGFLFAAAPQLMGVKAHPELVNNDEYISFYNYLIGEKKKGVRIFGPFSICNICVI